MALTQAQLQTLSTDLFAETDPTFVALRNAGNNTGMQDWYNAMATPDFFVFRKTVENDETIRDIVWTEVLGGGNPITDLEQWAFTTLMSSVSGTWQPEVDSNRDAIAEIFSGPQRADTRTNIFTTATKQANVAEKLFSSVATGENGGDGSSTSAVALTAIDGEISLQDVRDAVAIGG